jgi:hypothetical protein
MLAVRYERQAQQHAIAALTTMFLTNNWLAVGLGWANIGAKQMPL